MFLGEYNNAHWTLAGGLRQLRHTVTVVSDGDFWKNHQRDTGLSGTLGGLDDVYYMVKLHRLLPLLCGCDVVQIANPMFSEIKAHHITSIHKYSHKCNKRIPMSAFGADYHWVHTCCTGIPLKYSDFNMGKELRQTADVLKEQRDQLGMDKQWFNEYMVHDRDGIIVGLYEYWVCYHTHFSDKTTFTLPPIRTRTMSER